MIAASYGKMQPMELRQLRYFIEIADQRSFTRAAETLSIAQPALTTQVQKLEAELRAPLFVRNKRGITLTEVGLVVLAEARKTVDAADATTLAVDDAHARLVFGYSAGFPFTRITDLMRALRRNRPNVRIDMREMRSAEQVASLVSGAVDFAFVHDRPDLADLPLAKKIRGRSATCIGELFTSAAAASSSFAWSGVKPPRGKKGT